MPPMVHESVEVQAQNIRSRAAAGEPALWAILANSAREMDGRNESGNEHE